MNTPKKTDFDLIIFWRLTLLTKYQRDELFVNLEYEIPPPLFPDFFGRKKKYEIVNL